MPIHAGVRLTGKVGDFQVGLLNIQTGDAYAVDDETGLREQIAPDNNFGVLRAYSEFGNRTELGAIMVSRINTTDTDDYNLTYGIDGRLGIGDGLTFDGWAGITTTPVPTGEQAPGSGFNDGEYGFAAGSGTSRVTGRFPPATGRSATPSTRKSAL